jgi:hypothetical protein
MCTWCDCPHRPTSAFCSAEPSASSWRSPRRWPWTSLSISALCCSTMQVRPMNPATAYAAPGATSRWRGSASSACQTTRTPAHVARDPGTHHWIGSRSRHRTKDGDALSDSDRDAKNQCRAVGSGDAFGGHGDTAQDTRGRCQAISHLRAVDVDRTGPRQRGPAPPSLARSRVMARDAAFSRATRSGRRPLS